jgi:hypothetical protein
MADSAPSIAGGDAILAINELLLKLSRRRASAESRRADQRYPWNSPVSLGFIRNEDHSFRAQIHGWGVDLSYKGAGLLTECRVDPGRELVLQMPGPKGNLCIMPVRVMYCQSLVGNMFRLGVMFLFDEE